MAQAASWRVTAVFLIAHQMPTRICAPPHPSYMSQFPFSCGDYSTGPCQSTAGVPPLAASLQTAPTRFGALLPRSRRARLLGMDHGERQTGLFRKRCQGRPQGRRFGKLYGCRYRGARRPRTGAPAAPACTSAAPTKRRCIISSRKSSITRWTRLWPGTHVIEVSSMPTANSPSPTTGAASRSIPTPSSSTRARSNHHVHAARGRQIRRKASRPRAVCTASAFRS